MNPTLEAQKAAIAKICKTYGVVKLDVFGSANTPEFDPERSDFDFVMEFAEGGDMFIRFMEFADSLEALLGWSVDLVFEHRLSAAFLRR